MKGYNCIGLQNPKNNINVGSALRAAKIFGSKMIVISGRRYRPVPTDTMRAYKTIPTVQVSNLKSHIPYDCVPVAVEITDGAISLPDYKHPDRAFYIFGPEDGGLGRLTLSWCRDVICIPTDGCLNLGSCVNVVLYDRMCKMKEKE